MANCLAAVELLDLSESQRGRAISLALVPQTPLGQTRAGDFSMCKGCATAASVRSGVFAAQLAQLDGRGHHRDRSDRGRPRGAGHPFVAANRHGSHARGSGRVGQISDGMPRPACESAPRAAACNGRRHALAGLERGLITAPAHQLGVVSRGPATLPYLREDADERTQPQHRCERSARAVAFSPQIRHAPPDYPMGIPPPPAGLGSRVLRVAVSRPPRASCVSRTASTDGQPSSWCLGR